MLEKIKIEEISALLIVVIVIAVCLTACGDSSQDTVGKTSTDTIDEEEINSGLMGSTVFLDFPEDFLDYKNYIGANISLFGMEEGLEEYDGGTSSLYGHVGAVTICVGWDGTTITRVVLNLDSEEQIIGEEYDEVCDKLAEIFGDVSLDYGGITVYSGLTEYDFSIWRNGTAAIYWNEENRESYESEKPMEMEEKPNKIQITQSEPAIGMTAAQIRASTWGEPSDINRTTTRYGVSEQWVYRTGSKTKYIYFDDGIVTAIQE